MTRGSIPYRFRGQNAKIQSQVTIHIAKKRNLSFFSAFINKNLFKRSHINFEVKRSNITGRFYEGGGKKFPITVYIVFRLLIF